MTTKFDETRAGFHAALVALSEFVRLDRVLGAQIPEGKETFFGEQQGEAARADPAAAERFLEWFGLARRVDGAGGPPMQVFLSAGCPGLEPALRPYAEGLAESRVSVFAVRDEDDTTIELEDAITHEFLRVLLPRAVRGSAVGSTLVGRVAPTEGDLWFATAACETFRGTALFEAYEAEAARHELERPDTQPALDPLELEKLLRASVAAGQDTVESVEQELAELLARGPTNLPSVADISYALSATPRPGAVLGPLLEQIAFESEVEIERAQRLLLRLWNVHHAAGAEGRASLPSRGTTEATGREASPEVSSEPTVSIPPAELGKRIVDELEQGLASGENLETLFGRLEAMTDTSLALDGASDAVSDATPEELRWHVEDEGNVGAFIQEFIWDRGRGRPAQPAAVDVAAIEDLGAWLQAHGHRDIEAVREADVAAALVRWWAEGKSDACLDATRAFADFCSWLQATHELEPRFDASAFDRGLRAEQNRAANLESALTEPTPAIGSVRSWRVTQLEAAGWRLESGHRTLHVRSDHALQVGDLVMGEAGDDAFREGCRVLPAVLANALSETGEAD